MTLFYIDESDAMFPEICSENNVTPTVFKLNPRLSPFANGGSCKELMKPYLFDPTVERDYTALLAASAADSQKVIGVEYDQDDGKWRAYFEADPAELGTEEMLFVIVEQEIGRKAGIIKAHDVNVEDLPVGTAELREQLIATKHALSQRYAYGLAYRSEAGEALRKMGDAQREAAQYKRTDDEKVMINAIFTIIGIIIGVFLASGIARADTYTSTVRKMLFIEADSNGCQYLLTREGGITVRLDRKGDQICK